MKGEVIYTETMPAELTVNCNGKERLCGASAPIFDHPGWMAVEMGRAGNLWFCPKCAPGAALMTTTPGYSTTVKLP